MCNYLKVAHWKTIARSGNLVPIHEKFSFTRKRLQSTSIGLPLSRFCFLSNKRFFLKLLLAQSKNLSTYLMRWEYLAVKLWLNYHFEEKLHFVLMFNNFLKFLSNLLVYGQNMFKPLDWGYINSNCIYIGINWTTLGLQVFVHRWTPLRCFIRVYITQAAAAKTPMAPNVANQQTFWFCSLKLIRNSILGQRLPGFKLFLLK